MLQVHQSSAVSISLMIDAHTVCVHVSVSHHIGLATRANKGDNSASDGADRLAPSAGQHTAETFIGD